MVAAVVSPRFAPIAIPLPKILPWVLFTGLLV